MTGTNQNINITAGSWAEITIKEWVKKAAALGIDPTNPLNAERFAHHINTDSNGNPDRIEFAFDYFLNFVDWGIGKGVDIEHRDMLISSGATTRRPKRWFSDVFYKQVAILSHIITEKYALKSAYIIINRAAIDK